MVDVDKLELKRKQEEERLDNKRKGIVYKRTKERLISPTQELNNVNEQEVSNSNTTTQQINDTNNVSSSSINTVSSTTTILKNKKEKKYKNKDNNPNMDEEEEEDNEKELETPITEEEKDKIYKSSVYNATEDSMTGLSSLFGKFNWSTLLILPIIFVGFIVFNSIKEQTSTLEFNQSIAQSGLSGNVVIQSINIIPGFLFIAIAMGVIVFASSGLLRIFR